MSIRQSLAWLVASAAITIIGCDSSALPQREFMLPRGKVSFGNHGLPHVMVMLMPSHDGLRARGITNGSGEFSLISENGTPGIVAGEYVVLLKRVKLENRDQRGEDFLKGFETTDSSPIRVTITRETDRLDITVPSPKRNLP